MAKTLVWIGVYTQISLSSRVAPPQIKISEFCPGRVPIRKRNFNRNEAVRYNDFSMGQQELSMSSLTVRDLRPYRIPQISHRGGKPSYQKCTRQVYIVSSPRSMAVLSAVLQADRKASCVCSIFVFDIPWTVNRSAVGGAVSRLRRAGLLFEGFVRCDIPCGRNCLAVLQGRDNRVVYELSCSMAASRSSTCPCCSNRVSKRLLRLLNRPAREGSSYGVVFTAS